MKAEEDKEKERKDGNEVILERKSSVQKMSSPNQKLSTFSKQVYRKNYFKFF